MDSVSSEMKKDTPGRKKVVMIMPVNQTHSGLKAVLYKKGSA